MIQTPVSMPLQDLQQLTGRKQRKRCQKIQFPTLSKSNSFFKMPSQISEQLDILSVSFFQSTNTF